MYTGTMGAAQSGAFAFVTILALGATFSALEVVPLVLIGFEGYENLTLAYARPWVSAYKWPIYILRGGRLLEPGRRRLVWLPDQSADRFVLHAGAQPVHGHTALFGVYGMLGTGLALFCLKGLATHNKWRTGVLVFSFWSINLGLALIVLLSLLPVGLADVGERGTGSLVRTLSRISTNRYHERLALAASYRRYNLCTGRHGIRLVCRRLENRLVGVSGRGECPGTIG